MGRTIAVVSGKGGVGKSTITCGLALSLAKMGHSVCVIDLDSGLNNVDVMLNIENKVVYDISDCLNGSCRIKQALVGVSGVDNLYVLSSFGKRELDVAKFISVIEKLTEVFEFVIMDCPAGVGVGVELALNCCSEALVVVTPHVSSLRDADKVVGMFKGANVGLIRVVVNRIRGDLVVGKQMLTHSQIEKLLKVDLLGVVPDDDQINLFSSFMFKSLLQTKSMKSFNLLAHNLTTNKIEIYDYLSKYKGFIGYLRRKLKRSM